MSRVSLVLVCGLLWAACGGGNEKPDGGTLPDAGGDAGLPDAGTDAGTDAGVDGGAACSIQAQNCPTGQACMDVQGAGNTLELACVTGACDLVRQACGQDRKCSYLNDGGVETRTCLDVIGDAGEGAPCNKFTGGGEDTCLAGLYCIIPPGQATAACVKFCYSGADCASTQRCRRQPSLPPGSSERPRFCFTVETCTPVGGTACSTAGTACYPTEDPDTGEAGAECLPEGSVAVGAACSSANDCVGGAACFLPQEGGQAMCRQLCNPTDGGTPGCTGGTRCVSVSAEVGACIP